MQELAQQLFSEGYDEERLTKEIQQESDIILSDVASLSIRNHLRDLCRGAMEKDQKDNPKYKNL